jgi:hypothetical protein
MTQEEKIWVIISKDKKVIAKGTPKTPPLNVSIGGGSVQYRDASGECAPCSYTRNDLEAVEA